MWKVEDLEAVHALHGFKELKSAQCKFTGNGGCKVKKHEQRKAEKLLEWCEQWHECMKYDRTHLWWKSGIEWSPPSRQTTLYRS